MENIFYTRKKYDSLELRRPCWRSKWIET